MTDPMVAFVLARLDEETALANAATPGPWWHNPAKLWMGPEAFEAYERSKGEEFVGYGGPHPFTGCVASTGPADDRQSMADAAHIARHEPTRALREIESKRKIMEKHGPTPPGWTWVGDDDDLMPACRTCGDLTVAFPCATLRLVASVYGDHPDYLPEWKP